MPTVSVLVREWNDFRPVRGVSGDDRPGTAPAVVHATVRDGNYALSTGAMSPMNLRRRL